MKHTFKIGDRVRLNVKTKEPKYGWGEATNGIWGVITSIPGHILYVTFDDNDYGVNWMGLPTEFEKSKLTAKERAALRAKRAKEKARIAAEKEAARKAHLALPKEVRNLKARISRLNKLDNLRSLQYHGNGFSGTHTDFTNCTCFSPVAGPKYDTYIRNAEGTHIKKTKLREYVNFLCTMHPGFRKQLKGCENLYSTSTPTIHLNPEQGGFPHGYYNYIFFSLWRHLFTSPSCVEMILYFKSLGYDVYSSVMLLSRCKYEFTNGVYNQVMKNYQVPVRGGVKGAFDVWTNCSHIGNYAMIVAHNRKIAKCIKRGTTKYIEHYSQLTKEYLDTILEDYK